MIRPNIVGLKHAIIERLTTTHEPEALILTNTDPASLPPALATFAEGIGVNLRLLKQGVEQGTIAL